MLTLTRRMGESLQIGENACLTLWARHGGQVLASVMVTAEIPVEIDGVLAEPSGLPHGLCWHMRWLRCGDRVRIGEAVVRVGDGGKRQAGDRGGQRQVRIAIEAPRSLAVVRADDLYTALGGLCSALDHATPNRDAA